MKVAVVVVDGYVRGNVLDGIEEAMRDWEREHDSAGRHKTRPICIYPYNTEGYQLHLVTSRPISEDDAYDVVNDIMCSIDLERYGLDISGDPIQDFEHEDVPSDWQVWYLGTVKGMNAEGTEEYEC